MMPNTQRDIREQLQATNPEYQRLVQEHSRYETQLEQLATAPFLNAETLTQELELKKLRLRVKDQMEQLVARTWRGNSST
jgi:uncharacterized protein YdcH (DUF465 family)